MKKFFIFIFCFILIIPFGVLGLAADGEQVKTVNGFYDIEAPKYTPDIALLVNADTDTVIFSKNADKVTAPASLVKIVTAMVALKKTSDLNTKITCSEKAIESLSGTYSTVMGLKAGEVTTLEMLLYGMFLPSANDAAAVIADHFGKGDQQKFVDEMNEYVKGLGCKNTHFANAHGLDAESVKGGGVAPVFGQGKGHSLHGLFAGLGGGRIVEIDHSFTFLHKNVQKFWR